MSKNLPTGIHLLLTYKCIMECDHCFLYSGPRAEGTFTLVQIKAVLDELVKVGTIEWVYFEGGEPFLFYPLMLEGIKLAHEMGFKTGIVTCAYWATSEEDTELWLKPLIELGVSDLNVSDDIYHFGEEEDPPAKIALASAEKLGLPVGSICIVKPEIKTEAKDHKGKPVVGGGLLFKGRAVEKLTDGLPRRKYNEFTECTEEELRNPGRVHIDPYGNIHICQGLVIGNMFKVPLSELILNYDAESHPICGPLLKGGPVYLAEKYGVRHDEEFVSACHFCYMIRLALLRRFPEYLAPRQVYGIK